MVGMFGGVPVSGPRGEKGPDGNPVGTVISFMGVRAPKDYLACDGSVYNISDYSELADFFNDQFGSRNYFGGNGTTTFAVPDMRNLFLRGHYGQSSQKLSGAVGKKQEATVLPNVFIGGSNWDLDVGIVGDVGVTTIAKNIDRGVSRGSQGTCFGSTPSEVSDIWGGDFSGPYYSSYTARPVNMAVLYCIKVN